MKISFLSAVSVLALTTAIPAITWGQEAHTHGSAVAHLHIGINPTWRPADWNRPEEGPTDSDPTDNNKLWLFSMPPTHQAATPGWPNWEHANGNTFLVLSPVHEDDEIITKPSDPNKTLYTCDFLYSKDGGYGDHDGAEHLDGWSSAFGPQGAWNLAAGDVNETPAWNISLRRERISGNLEPDDFFMLLPDDTPVLEADDNTYILPKAWLADENAWGIHAHTGFYFWLDETDNEISVVLSAHDAGGLYQRSAEVAIRFAKTIVQPVAGDLNNDGIVDIEDMRIVIENWGLSGVYDGANQEEHDRDDHED